jgi:hypothetical protein
MTSNVTPMRSALDEFPNRHRETRTAGASSVCRPNPDPKNFLKILLDTIPIPGNSHPVTKTTQP